MQDDIEGLIELIEWYRDEYHKDRDPHSYHNEMIDNLRSDPERYYWIYEQVTDSWLDY